MGRRQEDARTRCKIVVSTKEDVYLWKKIQNNSSNNQQQQRKRNQRRRRGPKTRQRKRPLRGSPPVWRTSKRRSTIRLSPSPTPLETSLPGRHRVWWGLTDRKNQTRLPRRLMRRVPPDGHRI